MKSLSALLLPAALVSCLAGCLLLSGCGQKGPLVPPKPAAEVRAGVSAP